MKRGTARWDDTGLDQLLARGRLSGIEYDRIEERVLERVRPERGKRSWFALALAPAAASLFGVWLIARSPTPPDAFTPKGGGQALATVIDAGCEGPRPRVCRLGQTLMFSFGGSTE